MTQGRYNLAQNGAAGWHASAADGKSSTSGYRDLSAVLVDLVDGAWLIDQDEASDTFYWDVLHAPIHGEPMQGAFLQALAEAPYMLAVVESFGMGGLALEQAQGERAGVEYGPMDYCPAEYLVEYWRARGAHIQRWIGGELVEG